MKTTPQFRAPRSSALASSPSQRATRVVVYPRLGNPHDNKLPLRGPGGLILSGGGGHVHDAYRWMHEKLTGDPARRGGDIVVLRATEDDSYSQEFMKAAPFNSVQTICVPEDATPAELAEVARYVAKAEGVFFSGGQQSRYVRWKDTALMDAVQAVYDKGGVVGGTSAGLAILGEYVFEGKVPSSEVTTAALVKNPSNPRVTTAKDVFEFPPMHEAMTDTHFRERDRFGRLVSFLARQPERHILGIGVDEQTALCVDGRGVGHLERCVPEKGAAYLIAGEGGQVAPGKPLGPVSVQVTRIDDVDPKKAGFDFNTWQGWGDASDQYEVVVDGSNPDIYSVDPYTGKAK